MGIDKAEPNGALSTIWFSFSKFGISVGAFRLWIRFVDSHLLTLVFVHSSDWRLLIEKIFEGRDFITR